ncbi:DVU_1556 family methyltransferase [Pseudodesulfovibrio indicus]|uniref:DVU_1556 family methyltransferase n=1 Tax=Pseudodesulfovibrio indicus TaxID=1716143 RepID=UPI00292FCE6D|nr:class I SAM-dependent methyltransferase [Pseudodesulfovibrio indicus]
MVESAPVPLWEREALHEAAGPTLRPGGFELTDRAAGFIGAVPGWTVLDVGAGLGATVSRLRSRFGVRAFGVEPSAGQLARAHGAAGLIRARGDALPFGAGRFDAVFCECVLSLFDDRAGGLAEFHRVLRPGGFLVLSDLCASGSPVEGGASCADRAAPLADIAGLVRERGFSVELTEDHSRLLRDLAARLAWSGEAGRHGCGCGRSAGYFLMIARKQGAK